LHNVFGQAHYRRTQDALLLRMIDWYVRTADVAPKQRDPRGFPG